MKGAESADMFLLVFAYPLPSRLEHRGEPRGTAAVLWSEVTGTKTKAYILKNNRKSWAHGFLRAGLKTVLMTSGLLDARDKTAPHSDLNYS